MGINKTEDDMGEKEIVQSKGSAPDALIRLAVDKGADLEKLEKLLSLQERYEANEARKAYHNAMAAFKANPPKINKDRQVGYSNVKYSHASLYNVTDKISAELSKHGLSASWSTKQNGQICVTCKITHERGHSEETTLQAPADASGSKNAIQAIGSTITYLERYTLLAITGLATHDGDDDGVAAATEYIDESQVNIICNLIADKAVDIEKFCKFFKIEDIPQMPKSRYNEAVIALKAKAQGKVNAK